MQPAPTPPDPSTPQLADLDALVARLTEIGALALAEDRLYGRAWGVFADWCFRTGCDSLPATATTVEAWLADHGRSLDGVDTLEVLDAVAAVHTDAGFTDPTGATR